MDGKKEGFGIYRSNKSEMAYMMDNSLGGLIRKVNEHNNNFPDNLILKEDIIQIMKEEGTFIMLYYK